jgi:hypothetical protein
MKNLITEIQNSDKLSPQFKTAIIKKLKRIEKSRETEFTGFDDLDELPIHRMLCRAFVYVGTKEGQEYWDKIEDKLFKLYQS